MIYICHRINKKAELQRIPKEYGVELDLRDALDGSVYLEHDPFKLGEDFETYLSDYRHGLMILNIKSERIEEKVLKLVKKAGVSQFFFLDCSFPMVFALSNAGIKNIALRFSEYEGLDTLRSMAGKISWVWADCFTKCPLTEEGYHELKNLGYRICIVSPELQGRPQDIEQYAAFLQERSMTPDAVCTKFANLPIWKKYYP
ncbi:MAG: hypothetical protein IKO68_06020 [Oscillospiraceae bacterium]|nr:hypothetical protein [Oscillospiraceae bacterium]